MFNQRKPFNFFTAPGRIVFSLLTLGLAVTAWGVPEPVAPAPGSETAEVWINNSVLMETPHVNAVRVENRGVIEAATPDEVPFYFFNTQYFTNSGSIRIYKDFDYRTYQTYDNPVGAIDFDPKKAKVFHNNSGAEIISVTDAVTTGKINIEAAHIVNRGLISAENAGIFTIKGDYVDLNRGALEIKAGRNYDHESGLDDFGDPLFWGMNRNYLNGSLGPYQFRRYVPVGANFVVVEQDWGLRDIFWGLRIGATTPGTSPAFIGGGGNNVAFGGPQMSWQEIASPYALSGTYEPPYGGYVIWDGAVVGTGYTAYYDRGFTVVGNDEYHQTYQGVLVQQHGSDDVVFDVKMVDRSWSFTGDRVPEQFYNGVVVEFKTRSGLTNSIAGGRDTHSLYLIDEQPNVEYGQNGLLINSIITASKRIGIPDNYVVTRFRPAEFTEGRAPSYQPFGFEFYLGRQNSPAFVDSYYGFRITNIVSRAEQSELPVPDLLEADGLLQPGRIVIEADNLDLRNARIRAEGGVRIKTKHLVGSTNAVIDCQNLSLDIGNTNGLLVITNLVQEQVERFTGGVKAYSIAWGNDYVRQGLGSDPTADTTVTLHYHLLVVDAFLNTRTPVIVNDLTATSDTVVFKDPMRITEKLRVNAEHLSIHRDLTLGRETTVGSGVFSIINGQNRWDKTVAPDLLYFTNHAQINIPEQAHFGDDRDVPYESWVNYGTNNAQDVYIRAKVMHNIGRINAEATINIDAGSAILQDGNLVAGQSLVIKAQNLKMRFQTNTVGADFILDVSGVLTDGGIGADNIIDAKRGIRLERKPTRGDLLGTEIRATVADFESQRIHWPTEDRGASVAGFTDNAAIGRLVLFNGNLSRFVFGGNKGEGNAIYIDYLEFSNLDEADIGENALPVMAIEEGYTVYFAASNVPAELLDGLYDGRLRWVKEFPGHNSSMPLYLAPLDKTIRVNRSFRQSILFDTDDDGTANGFDLTPFGGGLPDITAVTLTDGNKVALEWMGIPGSLYRIEYKANVEQAKWELLKETFYDGLIVKRITYTDRLSRKTDRRFYRVVFVE
jgi:hypothetical protein